MVNCGYCSKTLTDENTRMYLFTPVCKECDFILRHKYTAVGDTSKASKELVAIVNEGHDEMIERLGFLDEHPDAPYIHRENKKDKLLKKRKDPEDLVDLFENEGMYF